MQLDYTPQQLQLQLRNEIRAALEEVMTPERSTAVAERIEGGTAVRECVRALAAANLLGVDWPKEYGGQGSRHGLLMPRAPRDLRAPDKSGGTTR
jgi:alkylation response protein AidB-like acyl-CoA dehydrogenase